MIYQAHQKIKRRRSRPGLGGLPATWVRSMRKKNPAKLPG
jgi:hypothetical protein